MITKIIKPEKKTEFTLLKTLAECINTKNYFFSPHARQRQMDRDILEEDVLKILSNKDYFVRNKKLDKYSDGYEDWNYCFEGRDVDKKKIRIILSFAENQMLIITVIRIK